MIERIIKWLKAILVGLGVLTTAISPSTNPVGEEVKKEVVIVAAGDIACPTWYKNREGQCQEKATGELTYNLSPRAVLILGDVQYPEGKFRDFEAFDRSWGRLKNIIYPVPGNHEYQTKAAEGYFEYFGQRAGRKGEGYYSFELGEWKVLAINSNCEYGACDAAKQGKWIEEQLMTNRQECVLAFMHHPLNSSGKRGGELTMRTIWNKLGKGGVDVVLAGHNHAYERFAPANGVRAFVVGTGGRSLYDFGETAKNSEVRIDDKFGVLKMTLKESGYSWEFIGVDGVVYDQGRDGCYNTI